MTNEEIDRLVRLRDEARKAKDFARADEIKSKLLQADGGMYRIKLLDEPNGTFWYWSVIESR